MCRSSLKVNADKSKVRVLGGQKGLVCEVLVDMTLLERVSEFWMIQIQMVPSGRKDASAIRSLLNARSLQIECARALREDLFVPVLLCGGENSGMEGKGEV